MYINTQNDRLIYILAFSTSRLFLCFVVPKIASISQQDSHALVE